VVQLTAESWRYDGNI